MAMQQKSPLAGPGLFPLPIEEERSGSVRHLNKPVELSVIWDRAEDESLWKLVEQGAMTFIEGQGPGFDRFVRLTSPTVSNKSYQTEAPGRPHGKSSVMRIVPDGGEDWTAYNRISFWVFPTLPGFRTISMSVVLHNEGAQRVPDSYLREGIHYFLLEPDRWNEVVWEIDHLSRDKVTGLEFVYRLQGSDVGATRTVQYDIGGISLQRVDPDPYEGWDVAAGRIAYAHTGYRPAYEKTAIIREAAARSADVFRVVDDQTGREVLTKATYPLESSAGRFRVLDFSTLTVPGRYRLEAGELRSEPFPIADSVWESSIWKTINFFYVLRCGTEIPGVHGVCHRDFLCEHEGKRIVINGGWHDAGDLSQGAVNTAEAAYAMLKLAATLYERTDHRDLAKRLREEAKWGLDWLLKTRFGDGFRTTWATMDLWTDGVIGTADDEVCEAGNDPLANFAASAAQAQAAVTWERKDPVFAAYARRAACEDWAFAMQLLDDVMAAPADHPHSQPLIVVSQGILAGAELYKLTGEEMYKERAIALAEYVIDCQQQTWPEWDIPMRGFFYTSRERTALLHFPHRGHEQAPVVALAELLALFPEHPQQQDWSSVIALHAAYLEQAAAYTAPYEMLAAGVYDLEASSEPAYKEQVLSGIRLSSRYYLRRFPVWYHMRGNSGTVLSQAKALTTAARVCGNQSWRQLAVKQLEWTMGRNPFAQSLMYGEGYNFAPQYTATSGNICGSLPVGIQTREHRDLPYWPAQNCYNYKEVWVHPSSRWLWLMADLYE